MSALQNLQRVGGARIAGRFAASLAPEVTGLKKVEPEAARWFEKKKEIWTPCSRYANTSDIDGVADDCGTVMPDTDHWRAAKKNIIGEVDIRMPHCVYTKEQLDAVQVEHTHPKSMLDKAAFATVWTLRRAFDIMTGYSFGIRHERAMVRRVVILETVAGVPGMVGAAIRHLKSLRKMSRDYGFIHTLLEEAENERMHLMMALMMNEPSKIVRATVILAQALFLAFYALAYSMAPRYCHRFVAYLEEEAVKTYSGIVEYIDAGKLEGFKTKAFPALRAYYQLPTEATLRDVFLCIRADEAHHREVNHVFADLTEVPNAVNPFPPGY